MKFPYGICDFYAIRTEDFFYIDRTDRIPMIEEAGKNLLFLRPRRFGKSLLLSTLENYYDAAKSEEFDLLFGDLKAGKSPTRSHSQYVVMNWDFSAVDPQGTPEQVKRALHDHINGCVEQFKAWYRGILEDDIEIDPNNALRSFQSVLAAVRSSPYKLYLLIDEYDNFANEVLMGGRPDSKERYEHLLFGEGAVKTVFKAVKAASKGLGLDRTFITGVSPVVLSDITSGHNIAENISMLPEFNDLCGFREREIADAFHPIAENCRMSKEKKQEALDMVRAFYNGYCFSYRFDEAIYNPTLALYFLKAFQRECAYPRRMLDGNLSMDKNKIAYISRLPNGERVVMDALAEAEPINIPELVDRFGVEDMLSPAKDETFLASLLYYFGVLTLTDKRTDMGKLIFRIPNLVIRKLYVERIRDTLLPEARDKDDSRRAAEAFYQTGDMGPLRDFIEKRYFKTLDNRDYRWANELMVKIAFLTLLFNDTFYIMDSEPALERRYADMTMIVRPDMRQYKLMDFLMEFKYIGLKQQNLDGKRVRNMSSEELNKLPAVLEKRAEAKTQLEVHRNKLVEIHGSALRLKAFSVVAVGFERIAWQEE